MRLHVYCLAEGVERLDNTLRGVSGASVRLVEFDEDLSAVVSVCGTDAFAVNRRNALAHHEVVRSITEKTTPLPARFGTLVTVEQLRIYVSTHQQAIKAKLAHVRGGVEMTVRMIRALANTPQESQTEETIGPGTAFLLEKRREILREKTGAAQREQLSTWLHERLGDLIKEQKISITPSETVILARADHLIDRAKVQEYRGKMGAAIQERPDIRFLVSGPWPPYSFANIELEFSSQFGVS
jgi:hypothetical protein